MKKKLGLLVIVLVAFVGILAGCQKDQKAGTSPEVEKKDLKL